MKLHLKRQDALAIVTFLTIGLVLGTITTFPYTLCILGTLVILTQLELFRRLAKRDENIENEIRQAHAEKQIYSILKIQRPLPEMRGWAISPDLGWIYISQIFKQNPDTVLECGSGVSTLLAAYTLKQIGNGMVISLEHEEKYALQTTHLIKEHGLNEFAQVIYAPLTKQLVNGQQHFWYDKDKIQNIKKIDLLLVDGPPRTIQPLSRFPALPLLADLFSENAIVLMDDANRKDEKSIVKMWAQDFKMNQIELAAEKGCAMLTTKK